MRLTKASFVARATEAARIARRVGRSAAAFRKQGIANLSVANKGQQDFVTVADRQAESSIRTALKRHFPDDGFLGEETGGTPSGAFWVVDPIDGTTNYIRGLRHWGVSMAFVANGKVQAGVIYDAAFDVVYTAVRSGGAFKDGQPIHVSATVDPNRALAIIGHSRRTSFAAYTRVAKQLYGLGIDYRRMGAAAIGLVRTADGVADLYYEQFLNAWDMLAGGLIAQEAGADVLMPPLDTALAQGGPVLAATPGLKRELSFIRDLLPGCVPL
jgi:myo-inositol-1(or 4)-monophosphatase